MSLGFSPANLAYGQFTMYEPYVAVDVGEMLDAYLETSIGDGAITDVNNHGYAVGWYYVSGSRQPFFFSPVDGGGFEDVSLTIGSTTFSGAEFSAMTDFDPENSETWQDIKIVGFVTGGTPYMQAAFWTWNDTSKVWEGSLLFYGGGNGVYSVGTDINADGTLTGYAEFTSGALEAFLATDYEEYTVLDNQYPSEDVGYGMGINLYEDVAGWEQYPEVGVTVPRHAFVDWPDEGDRTRTDIHPNFDGFSESYRINDAGHAVGHTLPYGETDIPTLWWDEGDGTWTAVEVEDLPTGAIFGSLTDINNENEVVGWFGGTSIESSAFYVQLSSDPTSGGSVTVDLNDDGTGMPLILYPRAMRGVGAFDLATCINDNGWIGGSCKPDAEENDTHPMLLIPQDVNNNGVPDIREILTNRINNATELDSNGNWLLDWAENDSTNNDQFMRVGLHAPGFDNELARAIDNVQIARFPREYKRLGGESPSFPDDFGLEDIVGSSPSSGGNCNVCLSFTAALEAWTRRDPDTDGHEPGIEPENEIVITIRNRYPTANPDLNYDIIPENPTDLEERLYTIRTFAYRFAHCIDYIQLGNESFQGAGEFAFKNAQGNPEPISSYDGQDLINAVGDVHEWILLQLEAARTASALAGRPLRFIGPGFPGGVVMTGFVGDPSFDPPCTGDCLQDNEDKSAYVIQQTNILLNNERMYFDLHLHYKTVAWAIGDQQSNLGVVQMALSNQAWGWTNNAPEAAVCLEWGPKAANAEDQQGDSPLDNWWKGQDPFLRPNGAEFSKYEFESDDGEPLDPDFTPHRNWELFITEDNEFGDPGWELGQFGDPSAGLGFRMDDVLECFFDTGYLVCCYGPTTQGAGAGNVFNIAALIATQVSTDIEPPYTPNDDYYIADDYRYSPLRLLYEAAADLYQISVSIFVPHEEACNEDETCPDC